MQRLILHAVVDDNGSVGNVGLVALVGVDADGIDICRILNGWFHNGSAFSGEGGNAWRAVALHVGEHHHYTCASSHLNGVAAADGATVNGSLHSVNHRIGSNVRLPADSHQRGLIGQRRCQRGGAGGSGVVGRCHIVGDGITRHGDALTHSHLQRVAIVDGHTIDSTRSTKNGGVACALVRYGCKGDNACLVVEVDGALARHLTLECLCVRSEIVARLRANRDDNLLKRTDAAEQRIACPCGVKDGLIVGFHLDGQTIQIGIACALVAVQVDPQLLTNVGLTSGGCPCSFAVGQVLKDIDIIA